MQPVVDRPLAPPRTADRIVLAVRATGQERLHGGLRSLAAAPEVLERLARVVVVDAGVTPASAVLREAVRLPAGLLRVVRHADATVPAALSLGLLAALDETASDVLVLDDAALVDTSALEAALARRSPATGVVGLRDPRAAEEGPLSWWGALLPADAIRAVGAALPEAGPVALADLALRAETAGFRWTEVVAGGPVPTVREVDRLRLALLHGDDTAGTPLLLDGVLGELRLLLRPSALRVRRAALRELLDEMGEESAALPRLRFAPTRALLQRRARAGLLERASDAAWALRFSGGEVNRRWTRAESEASAVRRTAVRLPAWPTTRRTSAA